MKKTFRVLDKNENINIYKNGNEKNKKSNNSNSVPILNKKIIKKSIDDIEDIDSESTYNEERKDI